MAIGENPNLWGLQVSGDVGDMTVYTDRWNRKTWFPKSPPKEPPTYRQILMRARFRLAQLWWSDRTVQEKRDYEALALKAGLAMTGQNLVIHCALKNDMVFLETIQRQTGITVPMPPYITGIEEP